MKPLLVIPPSPARWSGVESLLDFVEPVRLADLRKRLSAPLPGAADAIAIVPSGSLVLAVASIRRHGDAGVLADLYTRPDHRKRGLARSLLQTLLSWFDMTGGKRLYLSTTTDLAIAIFENFGFQLLHAAPREPHAAAVMLRTPFGASREPLRDASGAVEIADLTAADFPRMVELLQHRPGPDPRVAIAESAVAAEASVFELLAQQDRGGCRLLGASRGGLLVGVASLATDQLGDRTFAMMIPHVDAPAELRDAVTRLAAQRGYQHVEYPMEALAAAV